MGTLFCPLRGAEHSDGLSYITSIFDSCHLYLLFGPTVSPHRFPRFSARRHMMMANEISLKHSLRLLIFSKSRSFEQVSAT